MDSNLKLAEGDFRRRRWEKKNHLGATRTSGKPRVMAVSSGGGHWIQLQRIRPALSDFDLAFVTVSRRYESEIEGARFYVVPDSNLWVKAALLKTALAILWVIILERPDVILSTGAAPGYFAIHIGKWLGARTIWIDSIANVEKLSVSGSKAGRFADLWLTQWPHLSNQNGPHFRGSVL